MLFSKEFHSNGKILKDLKSTFVALKPNIDNPLHFKNFRPISMVRGVFIKYLLRC